MKKTRRPLVLTVKGKAEAVVMDPAVYQKLADRLDAIEGIRRGLAQAKKGMGRSVDDVFDAIVKGTAVHTAGPMKKIFQAGLMRKKVGT